MNAKAPVTLRQLPKDLATWSDAELLQHCRWHSSASKDLVAAAQAADVKTFGRLWRSQLRLRREVPATAPRCLQSLWSPVDGLPAELLSKVSNLVEAAVAPRSRRPAIKPVEPWLDRLQPLLKALAAAPPSPASPGADTNDIEPLSVLMSLEILWTLGQRLPQAMWWALWRKTLANVAAVTALETAGKTVDERLLLTGEIPLLAGLVYGDLQGSREMLQRGQRQLRKQLTTHTDTDGTPHSELLSRLSEWLAPLIRASGWSRQAGQSLWDEDERLLVSDVLEKVVALCRPDGQLALTGQRPVSILPLLNYAADVLEWRASNPLHACLKSLSAQSARDTSRDQADGIVVSVMPSNQSDWARFALLRSDWSATSASVAVSHHQSLPRLDVTVGGQSIIHGDWGLELLVDGVPVELASEWNCVCWESQPEADYVELQMSGPGRMQVERLVLLSREDHFVMLADSISGVPGRVVQLRSRLPLAAGLMATTDAGRRSLRLSAGRTRLRMYPLAVPVSTVDSTPHKLHSTGTALEWEQHVQGQGLFAPLILDFAAQRQRADVLWRTLTVTEDGAVVRPDVAAAFRWQVAREQWLIYRSLRTPKTPRATLGYHTGNSFAVGRFDAQGVVDPLLLVEQ